MKRKRPVIAMLCASFLLWCPPVTVAQTPGASPVQEPAGGKLMWLTSPYREKAIAPINLANTSRLDSLLRAGMLYLSLQDAIALALENNLDIELQRYGPHLADSDILRADAGGLLRGVSSAIQQGPSSALSQATGGAVGGGVGSGAYTGGGSSNAGGAGGTIITTTGTSFPQLDPTIGFGYYWAHATSPQSNSFNTGTNALVYENQAANVHLQKGFLTGTTVALGWNNSWLTTNAGRSDFNPSLTSSISLQVTQRLLQGFGLAVNSRNIRISKNNRQVSDLSFQQQVITTVSSIINLYWDLVSFRENVKVKQQALDLSKRLYEDNKKQVEIGTLAPIEVVRAEAEIARSQQELTNAETQVLQQETILKNALSRTGVESPSIADARIIPTDQIRIDDVEPVQPVQDLVTEALRNRPEITQTQIQIENTKLGITGSKSQLRPSLDLVASVQNNGLAGRVNTLPVPPLGPGLPPGERDPNAVDPFFLGGYGTALGQVFRRNFPDYSVGFQLNIPLRNRSAQADLIRDSLSLRQQELQFQRQRNQIRVDVQNALIGLQQARAAYEAANKSRVLQEQTLDAEQKKYALGSSTIFYVIQSQRDLAQAQSSEVSAMSAYTKAKVELDRVTGRTLASNRIEVDEAVRGVVSQPPSPLPSER